MSIPRTNQGLVRSRLHDIARVMGYRVSGNHVFSAYGYERICEGKRAYAVLEAPWVFPPRIVRLANILSRTY